MRGRHFSSLRMLISRDKNDIRLEIHPPNTYERLENKKYHLEEDWLGRM